jgi:polar amino acid transport system substrate-binding protein
MLFLLSLLNFSYAQDSTILVGVDEAPPFSFKTDVGWEGIAVSLWEEIAREEGWDFQYVESNFQDLLKKVGDKQIDVALSGITITAEREKTMDFSHSYLIEDVAVATRTTNSLNFIYELMVKLLYPVLFLFATLTGVGFIYFLLEKRTTGIRGFFDSIYWALTTMTTVGYGDESAKNIFGRLFSMFWMFSALFIFATINAQVLNAFSDTTWSPKIDNLIELQGKKVLTVEDSFSANLLNVNHVSFDSKKSEKEMIESFLKSEDNTFIVYDRSILEYRLPKNYSILEKGFYEQHLAFAIQTDSIYEEKINQLILEKINSEWWKATVFKYKEEK